MATIQRTPPATTIVSMKRSTRATRDPGIRDSFWEGITDAATNLVGGEIMTVGTDNYLVQSANTDPASGELAFFAVKTNVGLTPQRITASLDADNNIVEVWGWTPSGAVIEGYGQIVTAQLRASDPGLLDSSKYLFFVPASAGLQVMDRVILTGENLMVNAIDSLMLEGVSRIQCGSDTRT
jgi:hypothetical protein